MTAAQFELIDETEAEAILRWRFEELVRSRVRHRLRARSRVPCGDRPPRRVGAHPAGLPPETALQILL